MTSAKYGNTDDLKTGKRFAAPRAIAAVVIVSTLSGCSLTGVTTPEVTSLDKAVTGSVAKTTKTGGVLSTDAEVIKTTVASAPDVATVQPLAWKNPETGSTGTILAIDKFMGKHGQSCRGFKTSVANFMGISLYNGETCQVSASEWVLSWFKPAE